MKRLILTGIDSSFCLLLSAPLRKNGTQSEREMENDLLMYGDLFFDNFDDLLDFSTEETQLLQSSDDAPPPPTPPPPPISTVNNGPSETPQLPPPNSGDVANPPSDGVSAYDTDAFFCDDLDIAEMEWLSNFVEESFSTTGLSDLDTSKPNLTNNVMVNKGTIVEDDVVLNCGNKDSVSATAGAAEEQELLYLTHESPLSVLENNGNGILLGSTSSGISSSSSSTYYYSSSSSSPTTSSSCSGSMDPCRAPPPTKRPPSLVSSNPINSDDTKNKKKKKLKIKLTPMSPNGSARSFTIGNGEGGDVRKCLHCGIQKTPQWRAGPMGPKTLCNACGVRYKSGRLFPEYRPAASPTFIESVHSNSHKKVVEMRMKSNTWEEGEVEKNKKRKKRKEEEEEEEENCARPIKQVSSRCCELLNYIRSDKQWGSQEGRKDRGVII